MQDLDIARRAGVLLALIKREALDLYRARPWLLADDAAMAAALRGKGYTAGEVDAFLCLSPARAA